MACLASPNRANARQTPMARTQRGDMLQHNTRWLRTVRKTESSNNFPFFQPNVLRRVWLVRSEDVGMGHCLYVDLCFYAIIPTLFVILFGMPSLHLFTFLMFFISCYYYYCYWGEPGRAPHRRYNWAISYIIIITRKWWGRA